MEGEQLYVGGRSKGPLLAPYGVQGAAKLRAQPEQGGAVCGGGAREADEGGVE